MKKNKDLCVCIITKDDAALTDCIESVRSIADELIIIDLGSSGLGSNLKGYLNLKAEIHQNRWEGDRSEIKNFCLDKCTCRWIMFLEGNEALQSKQLEELKRLLYNPNVEGYLLNVVRTKDRSFIYSPLQALRLVRNRAQYRYKYPLFEKIPEEKLYNVKNASIDVIQNPKPVTPSEFSKQISLIKDEISIYPNESYLYYIYGLQLLNNKKFVESVRWFDKAYTNLKFEHLHAPHLYKCHGWALIYQNRFNEALKLIDEGIISYPLYTDLYVLRGEIKKNQNKYSDALKNLEKAINLKDQGNNMVPKPQIGKGTMFEILGDIHRKAFNYQQSFEHYAKSYQLNKNQHVFSKLVKMAMGTDKWAAIIDMIENVVQKRDIQGLVIYLDVLLQQRKYEEVLKYLDILEGFIGSSEQTKIIKNVCDSMLNSTGYLKGLGFSKSRTALIQHLQISWAKSNFEVAENLVSEIGIREDFLDNEKCFYKYLHHLVFGKEEAVIELSNVQLEFTSNLIGNCLWLGNYKLAKSILPVLLVSANDVQFATSLENWGGLMDYDFIVTIHDHITEEGKKQKFRDTVAMDLLSSRDLDNAWNVLKLGPELFTSPVGYVVSLRKQWEKIQHEIQRYTIHFPSEVDEVSISLNNFHRKMGNYFQNENAIQESIIAYGRAIQWNPLDTSSLNKTAELYSENENKFENIFLSSQWQWEGNYFNEKEELLIYIQGYINFTKKDYIKALELYRKLESNTCLNAISKGFQLSISILQQEISVSFTAEIPELENLTYIVLRICKDFIISELREGLNKFPYSTLLKYEIERLENCLNKKLPQI